MKNESLTTTEQSDQLTSVDSEYRIKIAIKEIQERHTKVSLLETHHHFIKKKMGLDYVQLPYMRKVADTYYPGWSWEIINSTIHTDSDGIPTFIMVHGRLRWYENGLWRSGDMVAGHRIQRKTGEPKVLVDPGNDIKAGNTDCMKKALNVFMNIADDVYKAQAEDPDLSDDQREQVLNLAKQLSEKNRDEKEEMIDDGRITTYNLKGVLAKLDRQITQRSEHV